MSKAHVKVLRRARKLIFTEQQTFICIALGGGFKPRPRARDEVYAMNDLVQVIERRLRNCRTLGSWIRRHHSDLVPDRGWTKYEEAQLRLTRLAWIDSLIEEFK